MRKKMSMLDVDRLNRAIEATGLDLKVIAARARVSYDYIYKLQNGGGPKPSVVHLQRIAQALNIPLNSLLILPDGTEREAGGETLSPTLLAVAQRVNELPSPIQAKIVVIVGEILELGKYSQRSEGVRTLDKEDLFRVMDSMPPREREKFAREVWDYLNGKRSDSDAAQA